jgi:translin
MNQLHQGRRLESALQELADGARSLAQAAREAFETDAGPVESALQECVEALLLAAVLDGQPLRGPSELGVDPEPFLLGLGDLVGELRRRVLHELSSGELATAEHHLALMESLTLALARFEAPRSIVALKPKQDQARAILERTRGDVTLARLLDRAHLPNSPSPEP